MFQRGWLFKRYTRSNFKSKPYNQSWYIAIIIYGCWIECKSKGETKLQKIYPCSCQLKRNILMKCVIYLVANALPIKINQQIEFMEMCVQNLKWPSWKKHRKGWTFSTWLFFSPSHSNSVINTLPLGESIDYLLGCWETENFYSYVMDKISNKISVRSLKGRLISCS